MADETAPPQQQPTSPVIESFKISPAGQMVLPKIFRSKLELAPGELLVAEDHPDGILLRKVSVMRPQPR